VLPWYCFNFSRDATPTLSAPPDLAATPTRQIFAKDTHCIICIVGWAGVLTRRALFSEERADGRRGEVAT